MSKRRRLLERAKKKISSWFLVAAGTFFMAAGTNMVYEPMRMVTGGFAGIAILLRNFISIPLWLITLILNIPLFFVCIKILGSRFAERALWGILCFSTGIAIFPQFFLVGGDYLMAALLGGVLNGIGLALIFRQGASTGGSDMLASLIKHFFPELSTAFLLAIIDDVIVVLGMIVYGVKTGLYSMVAVFVTSRITDSILEGMKFAKILYIISSEPERIAESIMEKMGRGVTSLTGKGMYSGGDKKVLLCAVSKRQSVIVVQIVKTIDEHAFVIISDAREVLGEGFGSDF